MKKYIALILVFVFLISLSGCSIIKNNINDTPIDPVKEVESIICNSDDQGDTIEKDPFYEDDSHLYIFGRPISDYVIVKYTDGSTENVKEALKNGHIQLSDLDKHNIDYFAEPKLIDRIVDLTADGTLTTADALECFYRDDNYAYSFASIKSHYVIVHYTDGTEQNVKDALESGKIKISDLNWFGIEYYQEPLENFAE